MHFSAAAEEAHFPPSLPKVSRDIVLRPVMWETHTYPLLDGRPQGVVNDQIVDRCDAVVGTFWTRIGSPTGIAESGTVEEIERMNAANKPVMLFFSTRPIAPDRFDHEQFQSVKRFKESVSKMGLYGEYNSIEQLRQRFSDSLIGLVNRLVSQKDAAREAVSEASAATAGTKSAAKYPASLRFNETPKIEKMHRDQGGTVVQHDYLLTKLLAVGHGEELLQANCAVRGDRRSAERDILAGCSF